MNVSAIQYDVFVSYNWRDHEPVEVVANALRQRGLNVFLDRWYLVPGKPWPQALEEVLRNCRSVAVFLSSNGMGPWQQREQYLALDRQNKDSDLTVIPVLLPGSDPALGFIGLITWVDLRNGINDPVAFEVLAAAVRGEAPGPAIRESAQAVLAAVCPYRGLQAFREEDALFFFGRDTYVSQLAQKVCARSLIAVVGASGSGKSSVVRAGLVPALRRNGGGTIWEAVTLFPGDRPLHALAAALVPLLEPEMTETDRLAEIGKLAGHFREGTVALRDVVERVLKKQPGTDRLLLVADQWEELYTSSRDDQDTRKFIDALLDTTAAVPVSVVLTVRGDFFGRVLSYRALEDRLRDGIVTLGPMNLDELRQVITKPAEKIGLAFQTGLSNRLLDDVAEEPGNLPLLEFVLTSLWDRRHRGELSHEAYDAIGGMQGAIAARADETYEKFTEVQRAAVRRIFLQLVRPGAGSEDTRRRAALKEVGEEAHPTLGELAKQRLLVTGRDDSTGEETVEVAHEALIQHWSRLRQWLDEDRDFLVWRQRLQAALGEWQRTGHDADVLLRGAPLAEAERWSGERQKDLGHEEMAYIQEGVRSRNRRRRFIRIGAAAVVILSMAIAFWQYKEAEQFRAARRPINPEMVDIPAGKFEMGASKDDKESLDYERPVREVVIARPFKIGKYEVTFDEYDKFSLATGRRPPSDQGWVGGTRPGIHVSWVDAVAYAKWLSEQTGKRYRLPTEAEWEYVARAGTDSKYWWGNKMIKGMANCLGCGSQWDGYQTAPVGSFKPNPFGVYDTAGNVWEWVEDCWHENYNGAPTDGSPWLETAAGDCGQRVVRGGSWGSDPGFLRSSNRLRYDAEFRGGTIGFRLAQNLP